MFMEKRNLLNKKTEVVSKFIKRTINSIIKDVAFEASRLFKVSEIQEKYKKLLLYNLHVY